MQKFIKTNPLLKHLLIIASIILSGCAEPDPVVDEDANLKFFDVVYKVTATRENKNYAWVPVTDGGSPPVAGGGSMLMKIVQSSETEGTFIFKYISYKEPQFVTPNCTGGFNGNLETVPANSSTTTTSGTYNPLDPYNTGASTDNEVVDLTDPTDPSKTISKITQFYFKLTILARSTDLLANCRTEADRTITIYRFSNGELVMVNDYRQLRMSPVLIDIN